jgi:serine/threonine protein kinase
MNILLHEGRVKIADYGCSIMSDDPDLDNYTYSVGTLYYLSPKTLKERKYSEKNDLWALGVIFY